MYDSASLAYDARRVLDLPRMTLGVLPNSLAAISIS